VPHPATRTSAPRPDPDAAPRTKRQRVQRPDHRRGIRRQIVVVCADPGVNSDATQAAMATALDPLFAMDDCVRLWPGPVHSSSSPECLCVAHAEDGQHQEKLRLTMATVGPPRSATASALTVYEIVHRGLRTVPAGQRRRRREAAAASWVAT
jgi:hypothetical protein